MRLTLRSPAGPLLVLAVFVGHPAGSLAQDRGHTPAAGGGAVTVAACVVREADYVRSTGAAATGSPGFHFVLTDVQTGAPIYSVTGVRESELTRYVGQRLELSGSVERARTTPVLTTADGSRTGSVNTEAPGAAGITPDGAAAHEPSDALSATVKAGTISDPGTSASELATLPRLNAASFRRLAGTCPMPRPEAAMTSVAAVSADPPTPTPSRSQAQRAPEPQRITARGCLVRQTPTGAAPTSMSGLLLTNASLPGAQPVENRSAVPGSSPSGSGSGTVPTPVGTSGTTMTFALAAAASAELREVTRHVGERVEIVGTVDAPARVDTAHPSATAPLITVTAFRALGGACG